MIMFGPIRVNPANSIRILIAPPLRLYLRRSSAVAAFSQRPTMAAMPSPSESELGFRPAKRPVCPSCSKAVRTCLCARIRRRGLDNSVALTVLQHSLEEKHPLNSTRIIKLGLKNATVVTVHDVEAEARFSLRPLGGESEVGHEGKGPESSIESVRRCPEAKDRNLADGIGRDPILLSNHREFVINMIKNGVISSIEFSGINPEMEKNSDDILSPGLGHGAFPGGFVVSKFQRRRVNPSSELEECEEYDLPVPAGSALLFPTDDAISVDELRAKDFEVKNLIVLDGTWHKAKRMYSENPWLRLLPHLKLDPEGMSLYSEVRSQPKAGCLSTLESVVYTLKALEDECSEHLDNLVEVFGSMVDDQRRCKRERLNKASTSMQ